MKAITESFYAFISYSRKDKRIANWLHSQLESYAYPRDIVNEEQYPPHKKYMRTVFLDTKDLQVEERPFTDRIKNALETSRFLILISSKNSAKSTFVDREVRYFLETHNNNYSLVIPMFIDEVNEDTIPPVLQNTTIMNRHFPIYDTLLDEKSEGNKYCFLQIAAYMLGVNFSELYNRYEAFNRRKKRRERLRYGIVVAMLLLVILSLGLLYMKSKENEHNLKELNQKNEKLIEFERDVFPAAVVFGYEENFLRPVINFLKDRPENFKIYVLMPTSNRDLQHQDRVTDLNRALRMQLGIDSLVVEHLNTATRRGSHIHRMKKDGAYVPDVYIDFASTTTSFYHIAEYKKQNVAYEDFNIDDIIKQFTRSFIRQTNKRLEGDSIYMEFVTSKEEMIDRLRQNAQQQ
ncbi:MAG: TIR domain-containing protein [Prevotella sp.]|nr:TIR domain-containing protein [Prevotella sp.]